MGKKLLIVIDMQQDFTYGALKNQAAIDIIPAVLQKTEQFEGEVIFTKDTHTANYLSTQEGRRLPVPHWHPGDPRLGPCCPLGAVLPETQLQSILQAQFWQHRSGTRPGRCPLCRAL